MREADRIRALAAAQVAIVANPARREALRRYLLAEPRREVRDWDYGAPGERYPYWVVAEAPEQHILLVYCEQGFCPESPWGFLFDGGSAEEQTLGMDSQW